MSSNRSVNTFATLESESSASEQGGDYQDEQFDAFMEDLDNIGIDELDDMLQQIGLDDFTKPFDDFGAEIDNEMLDALGFAPRPEFDRLEPVKAEHPEGHLLHETRKNRVYNIDYPKVEGKKTFKCVSGLVYISNGDVNVEIGVSKTEDFEIEMEDCDYIMQACEINESTNTKGCGLGFSSFVHLAALCRIKTENCILEPHTGFDLIWNGYSVEMTGMTYKVRSTKSQLVFNKYAIVMSDPNLDEEFKTIVRHSLSEDQGDPTFFYGTSFDKPPSCYTEINRRMMSSMMQVTDSNYMNLANMLMSWYSRQPMKDCIRQVDSLNDSSIDEALKMGAKEINGTLYWPAPFRVLPGEVIFDARFDREVYQPTFNVNPDDHNKSTFHNIDNVNLYDDMIYGVNPMDLPDYFEDVDRVVSWLHKQLSTYQAYCSMWVESELAAKIAGRSGHFYSNHTHVGILWKQTSSESLTKFVAYYRKGKPPKCCGKWSLFDKDLDIWLSPCFKMSPSDINHAKILPHRCLAMMANLAAYTKDSERREVVKKILKVSCMARGSSWLTSVYSKNFRFLVINLISRTGDPQKQIDAVLPLVKKSLSACDTLVLLSIKDAVRRFNDHSQCTPFLGLPYRFLNIEKDFNLTTMWHMRSIDSPFDTVKKLVKSAGVEVVTRDEELIYDEMMLGFVERAATGDLTQLEFDFAIEWRPKFPHFNPLVFMAMSFLACKGTEFGKSQSNGGVRITTLISDKRCITFEQPSIGVIDGSKVRQMRVADSMSKFLEENGDPPSIYHLMVRQETCPNVPLVNNIVEKGSKGANREIPQMTNNNRLQQMFEEKNLSIYVDQEDADFMTDPLKFTKFAEDTAEILTMGGKTSSEDKSSYCMNFTPEKMGLAIYCIARMIGSTGMMSSAALLLCDTKRFTILPDGVTRDLIPEGVKLHEVIYLNGKKVENRLMMENIKNFQQGQRAYAGACINTVFVKANDIMAKKCFPQIIKTAVRTTSDDSNRACVVQDDGLTSVEMIENEYFSAAIDINNLAMMENSDDKFMVSKLLGEFNNVTAGPNGLYNSSMTNANLAIQPLTGDNPMDDIITVVSASRSTLQWGTSIDVIRASYATYLVQLRQKWLFTEQEVSYLQESGVLPSSDAELIEGFCIRNKETRYKIASHLLDSEIESVLRGELDLIQSLRSFRVRDTFKKRPVRLNHVSKVTGVTKAFRRIACSRSVRGRANPAVLRPLPVAKRKSVKVGFMHMLTQPPVKATEQLALVAESILKPFPVRILPMMPQKRHLLPFLMGSSRRPPDKINLNKVRVHRLTGLTLTDPLTDEEIQMSELNDEEFLKKEFLIEMEQIRYGASWYSPAGCSLMRFSGPNVLVKPMAFTFTVDLPVEDYRYKPIEINKREFSDYKPLFISGTLLVKATKLRAYLPFGTGWVGSMKYAFHQNMMGRITIVRIPDEQSIFTTVNTPQLDRPLLVPNVEVYNPIQFDVFNKIERLWVNNSITGDPTAMLNYGNYLNTDTSNVSMLRGELMKKHGSREPSWSCARLREWPYFPERSTVIDAKNFNKFVGSKYSCVIKLDHQKQIKGVQTINLDCSPIMVTAGTTDMYDEEEELII